MPNLSINAARKTGAVSNITRQISSSTTQQTHLLQESGLTQVMNSAIESVVNSNPLNIVSRIRFHKILDKALPKIMTPENYLSKGRESKVYRISDEYVLKVRRGKISSDALHFWNIASTPNKKFNKLKTYYGEPLIKMGNIEVLKNATPEADVMQCGIPYILQAGENRELQKEVYKRDFLPRVASLPQESFDLFARDLQTLNKMSGSILSRERYYTPDVINPNNILISGQNIRIVDKLENTPIKRPNSIFTMLDPLLLRYTPEMHTEADASLEQTRLTILKKCLIASEKAGLPYELSLPEYMQDCKIGSEWALRSIVPSKDTVKIFETLQDLRNSGYSLRDRLTFINYL